MAPLTLSQLSPRKSVTSSNLDDQGPMPGSSSAVPMSPMRQPRKRPVSAVATDLHNGQSKKGKMVPRATHSRVITSKGSDAVNPSRPIRRRNATPKASVKSQGSMVRRRISSGSRLKSSQLSSSKAPATIPSASLASSSRNTRALANRLLERARTAEVVKHRQQRVMVERCPDTQEDDSSLPDLEDSIPESNTSEGQEVPDRLNITSKSRHSSLGVEGDNSPNNDDTDRLAQQVSHCTSSIG